MSDKFPKRVLTETCDAGFRMALMQKDIALYQQGVEAAGLPSNLLGEVARYWEQGAERYTDADFTEIFKLIDVDWCNVRILMALNAGESNEQNAQGNTPPGDSSGGVGSAGKTGRSLSPRGLLRLVRIDIRAPYSTGTRA